ncbi:MAG: sugar ABC transporter ATP-binding protein [Aliihoeflea sp.]
MNLAGHPRLTIRGLTKSFGGVHALSRADLTVMPGEIHGLLGKNGSGKSTLIKILSGYHRPDEGSLEIDGKPVALPIPLGRSEAIGLSFVHQNLGLLPEASVLENLIAGDHERVRPWFIDWGSEAQRARALFESYRLDLDPDATVGDLSPVKQAQLAIVRAADRVSAHKAHASPGLLVLDEPTPFLPIEDVRELFAMMRDLVAKGVSIVFVSHDIDEVMEITDRATVLRDGHVIGTFDTRTTDRNDIVAAIVGRSLTQERRVDAPPAAAAPLARVSALKGRVLGGFDLDLRPGEIVGLTGLIGSGYDEVPYLLSAARPAAGGRLDIGGETLDLSSTAPAEAIARGIAFIPADRQKQGLALDLTLTENAMLPKCPSGVAGLFLNHRRRETATGGLIRDFFVKAVSPRQFGSELSGGNQQKLLLGKWMQLSPRLILLDEPTQGIDVGARQEIYDRLREACRGGAAVICASSEFEQLAMIAHRVLVFERGRVKAQLEGDAINKSSIELACYGETRIHA